MQQSPQQIPLVPIMQDCVDAITEHQRLQALVKGEWVKGLLPQSSVRADYTVQRIRGRPNYGYIAYLSSPPLLQFSCNKLKQDYINLRLVLWSAYTYLI